LVRRVQEVREDGKVAAAERTAKIAAKGEGKVGRRGIMLLWNAGGKGGEQGKVRRGGGETMNQWKSAHTAATYNSTLED